ncbi:NUDIX hydrolase [Bacillus sp. FJAT-22090]|uniref:NUDIX hydrolase n=1 Tax=Bacillus sp. FJAT-22090 TaxID=1581038 RepID=UPI0006AE7603|nr:NUDIX domain-containing protein [Bacillus sp. FJAT-22090]ALC85118.1 NUDIX hydrolase [Bacillus sp. FJAT-22090]
MLTRITTLPKDKRIAGVHCIPITDNGSILMAWDKDELILTTIGGRIEENESLDKALEREAMEEVGIILDSNRIPFASWYWQSTDTYTVWFLVRVEKILAYSFDFEKTGYVIFNFETAKQIVSKIESNNDKRVQILKMAEERAKNLSWI